MKYQYLFIFYVSYISKVNCYLHTDRKTDRFARHIDCLWRAVLTDWTTESGSLCTEAAVDCLRAVSDGMFSVERRHANFNSYVQI